MEENKNIEKEVAPKKTATKKSTAKKKVEPKEDSRVDQLEQQVATMSNMMQEMMKMMMAQQTQMQESRIEQKPISEPVQMSKEESHRKITKAELLTGETANELVEVISIETNVVYKSPKTNIVYRWLKPGDVEIMQIKEIITMDNVSGRLLRTPWLRVTDERLIEALGLENVYEAVDLIEDVNRLSNMNRAELEEVFNKIPQKYLRTYRDLLYKKVKNREIKDRFLIQDLSEILDVDLNY
ncbi:MAG: hypothetical protein ACI3T9_00220 [Romboutsia timonensis]